MSIINHIVKASVAAAVAVITLTSCDDTKSYAERLADENQATNFYLSDYKVENEIPADSVFEEGPEAPFYRLDEEGNVYMQVLRSGDVKNNRVTDDELIYFRFTRYNLLYFYNYGEMISEGNADNMNSVSTWFRFNNTTLSSSTQYGSGIQMPLNFLGIDCEVNLIVKSQYGFTNEISSVSPYLYNLRYFKPMSN